MKLSKITVSFFDELNAVINALEATAVNTFAALSPWLAPLAPAYISWLHMTTILRFPGWVALAVAAVIELLGLSTISTAISFWRHNRRYTSDARRAPTWIALSAFGVYLVAVMTVNVVLALPVSDAARPYVNVLAQGLLSLLSVPAAVTLAIRSGYSELLRDIADAKAEAAKKRNEAQAAPQVVAPIIAPVAVEAQAAPVELTTRELVLAFYRKHPHGTVTEAGKAAQVSRQRASQIVKAMQAEGIISVNGKVTVNS